MKAIDGGVTAERLREVLAYEPATGVFTWLVRTTNSVKVGDVAGCVNKGGYVHITIDGCCYLAHRLAWLYMSGEWPVDDLDHINGDRADNRICNLRDATESQNIANSRMQVNNKSGFKGVSWHKYARKWCACIGLNGKVKHLGYFDSPEGAFMEYCFAAWRNFGDFANIDADYIRAVKKRRALEQKRRLLETVVCWNLARPDPNYLSA
jgi:hypothetical protein